MSEIEIAGAERGRKREREWCEREVDRPEGCEIHFPSSSIYGYSCSIIYAK